MIMSSCTIIADMHKFWARTVCPSICFLVYFLFLVSGFIIGFDSFCYLFIAVIVG